MKKRIVGVIIAFLLMLTLMPLQADAADSASSLYLTNNPNERIRLIFGYDQITIASLPDTNAFSTILLKVVDLNGAVIISQALTRKSDGSTTIALSRLSNGNYFLELYFSTTTKSFTSYIHGNQLRFNWNDKSGAFLQSPTYERNKKQYEAGRTDRAILAHYITATNVIQSTNAEIMRLAQEITSGITNDYDKALALHDWVGENIWYDRDVAMSSKNVEGDA